MLGTSRPGAEGNQLIGAHWIKDRSHQRGGSYNRRSGPLEALKRSGTRGF
jgi:hypothetical protein